MIAFEWSRDTGWKRHMYNTFQYMIYLLNKATEMMLIDDMQSWVILNADSRDKLGHKLLVTWRVQLLKRVF